MYRIEFFSQQIEFIGGSPLIGDVDIVQDHMTFEAFSVMIPKSVGQKKGDLCRITSTQHIMDGIVSDVQPEAGAVTVSVRPLQALFDQDFFWTGAQADAASWMAQTLRALYIDNEDTAALLPLTITKSVTGGYVDFDGDTVNVLDYIAELLLQQTIAVDCRMDTAGKSIDVTILRRGTGVTIQADLENVLEREITIGDKYGAANAAVVADKDTGETIGMWFLHPDGSIDKTDEDRITPVKYATLYATSDDAAEKAEQALRREESDIEIVLTYRKGDMIVQPLTLLQGTRASIYVGGTVYRAVLTGRELIGETVRLTFGAIRTELTKKLIIEGRNAPTMKTGGGSGGAVWPVGSIYITTDASFDPNVSFGGTWELLKNRFLVGAGEDYDLGDTGGEAAHALTVYEMPDHHHSIALSASGSTEYEPYSAIVSSSTGSKVSYHTNSLTHRTGTNQPHNNLPPYQAVNMWHRTA